MYGVLRTFVDLSTQVSTMITTSQTHKPEKYPPYPKVPLLRYRLSRLPMYGIPKPIAQKQARRCIDSYFPANWHINRRAGHVPVDDLYSARLPLRLLWGEEGFAVFLKTRIKTCREDIHLFTPMLLSSGDKRGCGRAKVRCKSQDSAAHREIS